jgi:ubiquinone/menaquinone biosynthesis C-methylase UbiE
VPQVVNIEETRKTYYGDKARLYDDGRDTEEKWRAEHAAVELYLQDATGIVLDIPVGTGRFLSLYRKLGLAPLGMDVSPDMMIQAQAKDRDADIRFGDIHDIPLADKSVESVVCIRLLTLIDTPDINQAMAEMARVATKRIIVSLKTEPARRVEHRSIIHPRATFLASLNGFRMVSETIIRQPYRVVLLERD